MLFADYWIKNLEQGMDESGFFFPYDMTKGAKCLNKQELKMTWLCLWIALPFIFYFQFAEHIIYIISKLVTEYTIYTIWLKG